MQQTGAINHRPYVLADTLPAFAVRDLVLVLGFAALVGLLAQLVIPLPFTPVPITGQTFGVLLGGMALGWRRAVAGMAVYVALGLVGVHWFAGGNGGIAVLGAPSFGYLIGFVVAAAALGSLAELRFDRNPLRVLGAMVVSTLQIKLLSMPALRDSFLFIYGGLLILVMLYEPNGLVGIGRRLWTACVTMLRSRSGVVDAR